MTKAGSKIFGKTEGIKPRERIDQLGTKIRTSPGMFLDTHHRAAKAEAEIEVLRNRRIPIAELHIVAGRKRLLSDQEFAELKGNLDAFPLINPITIRTRDQGGYELISGHNRVQAYVELGRTEIEANVLDLTEIQILPAAFYSNLLAPSLSDYEKYLGFKQLQEATGKTQADLALESGVSKTAISNLFAFDGLSLVSHEILSKNPRIAGYNLMAKIKGLPFVDEALTKLASGEISTQEEAFKVASQKKDKVPNPKVQLEPVIIKQGKQRFAEINRRGGIVAIKFSDETLVPGLMVKIEDLIRREIAEKTKQ